jgi:hypothetical protein
MSDLCLVLKLPGLAASDQVTGFICHQDSADRVTMHAGPRGRPCLCVTDPLECDPYEAISSYLCPSSFGVLPVVDVRVVALDLPLPGSGTSCPFSVASSPCGPFVVPPAATLALDSHAPAALLPDFLWMEPSPIRAVAEGIVDAAFALLRSVELRLSVERAQTACELVSEVIGSEDMLRSVLAPFVCGHSL